MSNSLIFFKPLKLEMLENIAYFGLGFVTVFLALEDERGTLRPARYTTNP